ncbi:MAG: hypothetical protein ACI3XQ_01610, partial [Eubacteriales bacterium]
PGDPTRIRLNGRFAVSRVAINGHEVGVSLFSDVYELAPYLVCGANELTVSICVSARNLFGPHHRDEPETAFVTPRKFSFENEWDQGECPAYRGDYSFIRTGIGF